MTAPTEAGAGVVANKPAAGHKPTKISKTTTMAPCPKCGCPDVHADSSSAAEASWIDCEGCDYRFQKRCDEETLIEKWNALNRKSMPVYDDGTGAQP